MRRTRCSTHCIRRRVSGRLLRDSGTSSACPRRRKAASARARRRPPSPPGPAAPFSGTPPTPTPPRPGERGGRNSLDSAPSSQQVNQPDARTDFSESQRNLICAPQHFTTVDGNPLLPSCRVRCVFSISFEHFRHVLRITSPRWTGILWQLSRGGTASSVFSVFVLFGISASIGLVPIIALFISSGRPKLIDLDGTERGFQ